MKKLVAVMEEIFKDIPGYEGRYQVSNTGKVKSLARWETDKNGRVYPIKERIMKAGKDKDGYLQVHLSNNNRLRCFKVHRLVAGAFISNPENKPEVDHKNGNIRQNDVNNLRWVTSKENANNPLTVENVNRKNNELRARKIKQLSFDNTLIKIWPSIISIEKELGYDHSRISHICRNSGEGYGYRWEYAS